MSFQVIPAIDLRGGRCVRLVQGDYARETVFDDDPVALAQRWAAAGARRIHLVDLDGARAGTSGNREAVAAIAVAMEGRGVTLDLGGGLRRMEDVEAAFGLGIAIAILGTVAVTDPAIVQAAARRYPGRIAVGIDARDGRVAIAGWEQMTLVDGLELATQMAQAGVGELIVTDIARDGMLSEPNVGQLARYVAQVAVPVIASGGVARLEHISALREAGAAGVIVGRALYTGDVDLEAALALETVAPC